MDFGKPVRVLAEATAPEPKVVSPTSCRLALIFCTSVGLTGLPTDPDDGGTPAPTVPAITGIVPTTGPDQTQVALTGSNFGEQGPGSKVVIGNQLATILAWDDTAVDCVVNKGTMGLETVVVTLIRDDLAECMSPLPFTFTAPPAPAIAGISPESGPDGTEVTIVAGGGAYFGTETGQAKVTIGGEDAVVVSWNASEIIVSALQGSLAPDIPWPLIVTVADGQTSGVSPAPGFTFTAAAREGEDTHRKASKGKASKTHKTLKDDKRGDDHRERASAKALTMPEFPSGGGVMLLDGTGTRILVGPFGVEAGQTYVLAIECSHGLSVVTSGSLDLLLVLAPPL